MKQAKWIVIPVEVQVRDLFSRQLVGLEAALRGFDVLVGQDRVVRRLARHLPKGVLYDKSIGMHGDKKVSRYHRLGYKITALDEESPGIYGSPKHFFAARMAPQTLDMAHRWFCISNSVQSRAIAEFPDYQDRFVVTGMTRTDVWRPELRSLFAQEVNKISGKFGRFVLFNSNFGTIIHARGAEFARKQYEAIMQKSNMPRSEYTTLIEQSQQNLDAYLEMLPKITDWFPDHKLVIRPHPSESMEFWQSQFAGNDRIIVVREGEATPWILASDIVVHHGCTTGIEAELMGKAEVMYAPSPDNHHDTQLMRDCVPIAHDPDTLRDTMRKLVSGENGIRKPRAQLENYFASLDGRMVSQKIVDEFEKIPVKPARLPHWLKLLQWTPRHLVAKARLGSKSDKAYSRGKWQGVSLQQFRKNIEIMLEAKGRPGEVEVSEPFPGLFHLSQKSAL
ncbi:MAG: hypothetical protein R3D32_02525 [Nitratireductor sp.]